MKRIFITGASAGIGLATAKLLAAQGHEVWGTSRDVKRIPVIPRLHPVALELRDRQSIEENFNAALHDAGHFDVVINNAGSGHFGPGESLSHEELVDFYQILVFAQIELMQLALRSMRDRDGVIINVSSLASRLPVPFMAAYNSAKAALASFTMSMQLELDGTNIRLIDLQPADISTDFNEALSRSDENDARMAKVFRAVDRNLKAAPKPDIVASKISKLIAEDNPPPRVTVGDPFQSVVAPFIFRALPQRVRLWGLKKYYGI
jgi:NAD(P)-dependent dehydrogenase (short-subunit alcohol dehydrogenase family)